MDEVTLRLYLAEAEVALHRLMTGSATVEVRDSSGELIRFNVANASRLRQYIADLKLQLRNFPQSETRGPMRPVFF